MVVSDVRVISIMECLLNSVDVAWSTDKAQPGANADVTITSEPFSLCSLGVVDKSVQLLSNNKNSLTMKKLLKLTRRASAASSSGRRKNRREKRAVKPFAGICDSLKIRNYFLLHRLPTAEKKRDTLPTKLRSKRVRRDNRCHGSYNSDYVDASVMFRKAGVHVLSDLKLKTRPCIPRPFQWVGRAVCVHPSKGVGVSNPATFITFKEFFVDLTLPPSVKRGEIFPVKISVFNYLNDSLPIRLILESPVDQFDILADSGSSDGSGVRDTCVSVRDKTVVSIRIRAKEVGDVNISVKAVVQENAVDDCGSGNVQQRTDFLVKSIRVSFKELLKEDTKSKYVCSNESVSETWSVAAPDLIVPNSARGFVAIVGDVMGPTLEVSCVTEYEQEKFEEILVEKFQKEWEGYKRELKYRHRDGSFSAFGESDKSGSTWLTAFVLKSFAQARPYIKVEPNDLNVSKEWLKSKQLKNGCFESVGKVLHKGMKGGLSGLDSPSLLTAFVLIALIEAGESVNSKSVGGALFCLNNAAPTTNPYSLAVKTYALALAKSLDTQATLDQLLNRATISDDTMYWQLSDQHESSLGAAVETASYALLALLTIIENSAHPKLNYYLPQDFLNCKMDQHSKKWSRWIHFNAVDGSIVTLYVDELSTEEICLSLRILREADVENPKPGTVKVYDYYKPEYQVNEVYTLPPPTECADKV
ncbi:Alpha-2-macroglobulin-like protein 1 [Armadillidium vulgare]|nr:Alpha-2-macroglobulin-like protein 1 [Armadillidium vulgare]